LEHGPDTGLSGHIIIKRRCFHEDSDCRDRQIFDGRNIYDPELVAETSFGYDGIGRGTICNAIPDTPITQISEQTEVVCINLGNAFWLLAALDSSGLTFARDC
jgi:hypothetical protein